MDAWLLTDDQQLALRVHEALARIRVSCPESRVVNIASLDQVTPQLAESSELFVFAVRQFYESHTDLIQRVRITFTGTLVIVAALPTQATLLRAIRAGADDFIDADGPLNAELADLVARLESQSVCADADSHLITIIPCLSSGDGNFVAVNVAAVLARRSGGCVLLDFHMRGGDLAMLLQLAPKHTFLELVRQRRNIDQSMLEQALTQHDSGIRLLAGPDMFSEMQDIQLHVSQQILDIAKSLSPYVVVGIEDIQKPCLSSGVGGWSQPRCGFATSITSLALCSELRAESDAGSTNRARWSTRDSQTVAG
jgi:pilus assembly protein CpaE